MNYLSNETPTHLGMAFDRGAMSSSSDDDDDDAVYMGGRVISEPETDDGDGDVGDDGRDIERARQPSTDASDRGRGRRTGQRRQSMFTALSRGIRSRVLQMSSDEDSDSSDDDDVMRTGEDEAKGTDEVGVFLDTMAQAHGLAQGLQSREESEGARDVSDEANANAKAGEMTPVRATSGSRISNVIHEIGSGAAALLTSPAKMFVGGEEDRADAGYIVARVRAVRTLLGLFVRVHLESGHDLLAMDAGNTSDPYVKVTLLDSSGQPIEGQMYTTSYRLKTLNPVFDESFFMGDSALEFKNCQLKFEVFDFDIMSSDDVMGSALLPLYYFAEKLIAPTESTKNVKFSHGTFEWVSKAEIRAHLNLVQSSSKAHMYQEALAMLSFAKDLLNPRNIGKSLAKSSVGNWLNDKIEKAIDIGKRKALRSIDAVIDDKKAGVVRAVKSDRDMPGPVANYIAGIATMYVSDFQKSIMRDLSMRLKITDAVSTRSHKSLLQLRKVKKRSMIVTALYGLRTWFLYNECPYDMTVWGKLRNPWWWILLACKLWYGLGVQAALFFIRLVLVDRTDEWQMFHFILAFKGVQFLTGVISIFSGVFAFIQCAGIIDIGQAHTCSTAGPWYADMETCAIGLDKCVSLNGAAYMFRILMCWYAFRRLRKSFAFGRAIAGDEALVGGRIEITMVKAGPKYKGFRTLRKVFSRMKKETPLQRFRRVVERQLMLIRTSKERQTTDAGLFKEFHYVRRIAKVKDYNASTDIHTVYFRDDRSRKLQEIDLNTVTYRVVKLKHVQPRRMQRILLGYEIISFLITAGVTLRFLNWVDWGRGETWKVYGVAFWAQTFYNLLAFPFILAVIPGLQKLICHAPKTGYDHRGNLVLFRKRPTFEPLGEEAHPRSRIIPAFYPLFSRLRI